MHHVITNLVRETGMDWNSALDVSKKIMDDVWPEVVNYKENRRIKKPVNDTIGEPIDAG